MNTYRKAKIWLILLEPFFDNIEAKHIYSERIKELRYRFIRKEDDIMLLYNKIDLSPSVISYGMVNNRTFMANICSMYPGILNVFQNRNLITRVFNKYRCKILPFQTGTYYVNKSGSCVVYAFGPDEYVEKLWRVLQNFIK